MSHQIGEIENAGAMKMFGLSVMVYSWIEFVCTTVKLAGSLHGSTISMVNGFSGLASGSEYTKFVKFILKEILYEPVLLTS